MYKNLKFPSLLIAVVALCAMSAEADTATGSFEKTLKVSGKADISVETGAGSISVRAGETNDVHIYAKIRARDGNGFWDNGGGRLSADEKVKRLEADPPIRQEGDRIIIGKIEDRDLRNNVSISYEISVPPETQLEAHSGSGELKVSGIEGPLEANTGSGGISVSHIKGNARVETGSGDVDIDNIKGRLTVQSGSGSVKAQDIGGAFSGHTGSGGITIDESASGDVSASTGSGSIHLHNVRGGLEAHTGSGHIEADGEATSSWRLRTGSGGIDVRLPNSANFDLDAQSGSGGVSTSHPVTIQGNIKRNHIQGKVGNGGVLVALETGSGSINVD